MQLLNLTLVPLRLLNLQLPLRRLFLQLPLDLPLVLLPVPLLIRRLLGAALLLSPSLHDLHLGLQGQYMSEGLMLLLPATQAARRLPSGQADRLPGSWPAEARQAGRDMQQALPTSAFSCISFFASS